MEDYIRKSDEIIEELRDTINTHIAGEETHMKELLKEIKEMREEVAPLVEIYKDSIGTYRTVTFILKFVALVAAGLAAILFIKKM